MKAPNAQERRLTGLARALRTAVVVPSLFALALLVIKQPAVAGFAVFGTFAHLVLTNYDPIGRVRFAQAGMLTLLGLIMVTLGTLASANVWFAVGSVCAVGALSELPALARGRLAAIRGAVLLSFLCAAAAPAQAHDVRLRAAGWLIAGLSAQPALLLIWTALRRGAGAASTDQKGVREVSADHSTWFGRAVRAGSAFGLAILLTRLIKVEHAFWVVLGVLPVLNARCGIARTFWQEQAGTAVGFSVSAALVAIIGEQQAWYWYLLPLVVFVSTYAASAVGLMAGQAAFTVFAVVLFCILLPQQRPAGILRLEDIAIGGAVSLMTAALLRFGRGGSLQRTRHLAKI